jgi:hypothetical protein
MNTTALQDLLGIVDDEINALKGLSVNKSRALEKMQLIKDKINSLMPKERETHIESAGNGYTHLPRITITEVFENQFPTHPTNK